MTIPIHDTHIPYSQRCSPTRPAPPVTSTLPSPTTPLQNPKPYMAIYISVTHRPRRLLVCPSPQQDPHHLRMAIVSSNMKRCPAPLHTRTQARRSGVQPPCTHARRPGGAVSIHPAHKHAGLEERCPATLHTRTQARRSGVQPPCTHACRPEGAVSSPPAHPHAGQEERCPATLHTCTQARRSGVQPPCTHACRPRGAGRDGDMRNTGVQVHNESMARRHPPNCHSHTCTLCP